MKINNDFIELLTSIDKLRGATQASGLSEIASALEAITQRTLQLREEVFHKLGVSVEEFKKNEQHDAVNHPSHYTSHPSGIECIQITRHYNFDIGNAIKYLWRAGLKAEEGMAIMDKEIQDCEKAIWYINDHITQLKNGNKSNKS